MAEFITLRTALLLYWQNILALGALLFGSWRHAMRAGLIEADIAASIHRSAERWIIIAQGLYAFGAVLCVVSTY
jgi:hypothetical protein